jgi:hypothetical protein
MQPESRWEELAVTGLIPSFVEEKTSSVTDWDKLPAYK